MEREVLRKKLLVRGKSYVPQWEQDETSRDLGMALVELFVTMHLETLEKYKLQRYKSQIDTLNYFHATKKSSIPSSGYVTLGLSNEDVAGAPVPFGTALRCSTTFSSGGEIPLETQENIFVTPATLDILFETDVDYIAKPDLANEFPFMSMAQDNLQEHMFYLTHPNLLQIQQFGDISLTFFPQLGELFPVETICDFMNHMDFFYSSTEGFLPFLKVVQKNGSIILSKVAEAPAILPITLGEVEQCCIQCILKDSTPLQDFRFRDVRLSSFSQYVLPENIHATGIQVGAKQGFYPFTQRPTLYDEVYFACGEVLRKKGAQISFSFIIEFHDVPVEGAMEEDKVWKLVMAKKDVKREIHYDITVKEVVFEYFNGKGYVNLFSDKEFSNVFSTELGVHRQKHKIVFTCPSDLSQSTIGGVENFYIRTRILRMTNSLKTNATYIAPYLEEIYFAYHYEGWGLRPDYILEKNNLQEKMLPASLLLDQITPYCPIHTTGDRCPTLYFGFSKALEEGPISILFDILKQTEETLPHLYWEFYSPQGFQPITITDDTKQFRRTGLVTFSGCKNHSSCNLYGEEKYYIRIQNRGQEYGNHQVKELPKIKGIYCNSVKVQAVRTGMEKFFTFTDYEAELDFQLEETAISSMEVYINETATLSPVEEENLGERMYYVEESGTVEKWVKWVEIPHFDTQTTETRCYTLDKNQGILSFSKQFSLPAPKVHQGIWVHLSCGGGEETNIQEGSVTALDGTIGFVSKVNNHLPFYGGADEESVTHAIDRTWSEFKHGFRAVTPREYETIVSDWSQNVSKVQCFSNRNTLGELAPGYVTLVVLTKEYQRSSYYFYDFRQELFRYLEDKVSPYLLEQEKLQIISPCLVKINVTVDVIVKETKHQFHLIASIKDRLAEFLHPLTGNFNKKGFAIGECPNGSQVESLLKDIKEVEAIVNLRLTGEIETGEKIIYLSMEQMRKQAYILPLSGKCQVNINSNSLC